MARSRSWTDDIISVIDARTPDAPLPVYMATVKATDPLAVMVNGIEYAGDEVHVAAGLLKHEAVVTIPGLTDSMGGGVACQQKTATIEQALEVGDRVAVVQTAGKQSVILLTKLAR